MLEVVMTIAVAGQPGAQIELLRDHEKINSPSVARVCYDGRSVEVPTMKLKAVCAAFFAAIESQRGLK